MWVQPILAVITCLAFTSLLNADSSPLFGYWQEPAGSIMRVEQCTAGVCLWIVYLDSKAPSRFDIHNPDSAQRSRPLCNLKIGSEFHLSDSTHAVGGRLYDPKSGRTYRGNMAVDGNDLRLRGYIGTPLFGKTETWRRVMGRPSICTETGKE